MRLMRLRPRPRLCQPASVSVLCLAAFRPCTGVYELVFVSGWMHVTVSMCWCFVWMHVTVTHGCTHGTRAHMCMHQVAAAEAGGKVYVAGGWDGGKYLRSMEVYDTAVSSWVNAPRFGG